MAYPKKPKTEKAAEYPAEVEAFHAALRRLAVVRDVDTGLKALEEYEPRTYSFPGEFGDLPHALLRRTNGGLPDESWANTELDLARDERGWLTLEFLAWWVRDCSRAGSQIQLRPMALPPKAYDVQLGRTLKLIIDQFVICPDGDLAPALAVMAEHASSLNTAIDLYADLLGQLQLLNE